MLLKRNIILPGILGLFLLFFIASAFLYFCLPRYIESNILPQISKKTGIPVGCKVRRIGFTGMDLGSLRLGDSDKIPVSINSIQLDYSPLRLFKRHIDSIIIGGLELNCEMVDGNFIIPGFDWQKAFPGETTHDTPKESAEDQNIPLTIGSLKICNAVLVCRYHGQNYRLPFDISLFTKEGNLNTFECTLRLYPRDQELTISSYIDIHANKASLKFHSHSFQLDKFPDIAQFIPELVLSGLMNINGTSEIQLNPFQISRSTILCEFHNTRIDYRKMTVLDSQSSEHGKLPLCININAEEGLWQVNATNIFSPYPLPVQISDATCNIQSSQKSIESSGYFTVVLDRSDRNQHAPIQFAKPLHTQGSFSAKFAKTGEWEFALSQQPNSPVNRCEVRYEPLDIASSMPSITVSGKGEKTKGIVNYAVQLHDVDVHIYDQYATMRMPLVSLIGNTKIDGNFTEGMTGITAFEVKTPNLEIVTEPVAIKIPEFSLQGEGHYLQDSSFHVNAITKFENAEVLDVWYNTKTTGIRGELPLQWPCKELGEKGKVSAEAVYLNAVNLGTASGTIYQKGFGIIFEAEHTSALIAGLTLNSHGTFDLFSENGYELNLDFKIPQFQSDSIDFGNLLTSAKGVSFGGELELDGNLFVNAVNMGASTKVSLRNSRLDLKEKGITIEGMNQILLFPDLLAMRSAPHQQFQFEKLSIGELAFYNGRVEFQIESSESFFVENCEFTWCNGRVFTHAMQLSFDKTDYNIALICDRLNLAALFDQFGIAKAEGSGTVSGRLPLRYESGNLSFDNGFLYSAPGDGGIIHVMGMSILDIGIPPNTPQYSQINFINAVLKDFQYNWVKILLTTKEEDLLLQMSLDGKPINPLPFTYNRKLGSFSKIEAASKGGIYNPIHLDINFRLPLNKIMYYGKNVNDIMSMLQY
ncbi:MAG: YdbH domain-containing protein [Candidatus Jettenia sp.]|nr:YdbH domain-containing protein [Candidatus Jettenia sp.]